MTDFSPPPRIKYSSRPPYYRQMIKDATKNIRLSARASKLLTKESIGLIVMMFCNQIINIQFVLGISPCVSFYCLKESLKKIKATVAKLQESGAPKVRLMFQDEAGFGRINKPKYCWSIKGQRPSVPCHHIREYRYVYGAIEPLIGKGYFLIMPNCDSGCMNVFLSTLSKIYPNDRILLRCDGAAWHKSAKLDIPDNICMFFIPPYTPEMNPIEQIWKEIRLRGFRNQVFPSLN